MVDKPAERDAPGRQRRAKSTGTVSKLNGANKQLPGNLDCLPMPMLGIDLDKRICLYNRAAVTLLGLCEQQLLGKSLPQLLPEFSQLADALDQVLTTGTCVHLGRFPWRRAEPSRLFELSLYPGSEELVAGALLRIDDVTEQAQREEFFILQEKLESISNLATGVSHEINNPLASILQNLQVMRNRLHPNLPKNIELAAECGFDIDHLDQYIEQRGIHAILNAAIEAGKKAADVVQNMLNFSHKDNSDFQYHNISTLLDKAAELATGSINRNQGIDFRKIELVRQYDQELPACYCSPGQLQQVFLHLLNAGANALSKRLHFWEKHRATLPSEEKPRLILRLKKREKALLCEIEDNGCGMEEELRKRIFEPFYATRKPGIGTGLGMSTCYFIICKNHGGRMSVNSRPDLGSRFTLELPLHPPNNPPFQ